MKEPVERVPFTQWANVHRTERFICVEPLSGYRRALREDEGYFIYLPPDATDDALGKALLEALAKSRFIWPADDREFFEWPRYLRCYHNWQKDFMHRYGYKTKAEAYRSMDWCQAKRSEGSISIEPHQRGDKPEHFRYLPADQTVVIPATTEAVALGAALRLALRKCE